jgi:hypothetical protein
MFEKLTNWLAANVFISDADVQTHADVAAAQKAELDRQRDEGKRGLLDYWNLSGEIADAGSYAGDFKAKNSGIFGFAKIIPWWLWLGAIVAGFWYLGGFVFLKGILSKLKKTA